jgi:D-glycero-alpha-D-manno-heptose-7-phosphate kinase
MWNLQERKGDLTIDETSSIEEGFRRLNLNKHGILFALDAAGKVSGTITDGDIRRHLLINDNVHGPLAGCINRHFVFAKVGSPREQILKLLDHRIQSIPILDDNLRLVDVYTRERFLLEDEREVFSRARSPARISFGGGGTDLTHYFYKNGGAVINAAVTLYAHATLRKRADGIVRIYSHDFRQTVTAESPEALTLDGTLDLIKSAVRLIEPNFGFELEVAADFPVGSGLGGSAVVSSAIIGCFNEFRSDKWDRHQIAEMAFQSERLMLNIPGGWQDQYATVFGGFNFMEFTSEHNEILPLRLETRTLRELEESLVLVYTGLNHDSGAVHQDQRNRMTQEQSLSAIAERQKEITREMKKLLLRGRLYEYGRMLNESWNCKRSFSDMISSDVIDRLYDLAINNHAIGGKLLGAGGGGYFLFFLQPFHRYEFSGAMEREGYRCQRLYFDEVGLQSWKTRVPQ